MLLETVENLTQKGRYHHFDVLHLNFILWVAMPYSFSEMLSTPLSKQSIGLMSFGTNFGPKTPE